MLVFFRMGLKATAILLPLLGLTWTLAFFTVSSERELAIVFTYLFTISNSFQVSVQEVDELLKAIFSRLLYILSAGVDVNLVYINNEQI